MRLNTIENTEQNYLNIKNFGENIIEKLLSKIITYYYH